MANRYPLKHQADGDIQRFTRDEEHWLAYQASLRLMMDDSTAPYQLSTLSGNSIGSFTDTFFNEAVGTHPGSALSTGSTVTTLYQRNGSDLDSANANFRTPINVESNSDIGEMSSAEFYELSKRLAGHAMVNEYLGSFRLGSSAPAGYTVHLSNVFSDTQTDGTTVNYSIYKRTSGISEPTKVNPMSIKRSGGYTGTFQGLQAMDSAQCVYTLGNHMKYYMMDSSGNIGNYQLRSSTQGAPTLAGTWSTRGTATDTKKTTSDVDYTRNSTADADENFTSVYETDYTADYEGNFVGDFTGNYIGDFTGDFVGPYTGNFEGAYTRVQIEAFEGTYLGAITYTGNFTGDFTGDFIGTYINPDGQAFSTNYTGNFAGPTDFVGNWVGGPLQNIDYQGNWVGPIQSNYETDYAGTDYLGAPARVTDYTRSVYSPINETYYLGNYVGNFLIAPYEGNYTRNSTRDSTRGSVNPDAAGYAGNYSSGFTGDFTGTYTRVQDENFTRNSTADSTRNSTAASTTNFTGNYIGTFTGDFVGTYTGDFTGNYFGETIQSSAETVETYTLYVRVA
jgi:outer membrane lipoprotein SlyB